MRVQPILVAILSTLACLGTARSQSVSIGGVRFDFANEALRPRTPAEKAFAAAYLAAVASRKAEAIRALVHPASIDCSDNEVGRAHLAEVHAREATRVIPPTARLIVVRSPEVTGLMTGIEEFATLPVQPVGYLGIDYSEEVRDSQGVLLRHKGTTVMRLITPHEGAFAIVEYCMTEKGRQMFLEKRAKRSRDGGEQQSR